MIRYIAEVDACTNHGDARLSAPLLNCEQLQAVTRSSLMTILFFFSGY